jgi:hypothetical protein
VAATAREDRAAKLSSSSQPPPAQLAAAVYAEGPGGAEAAAVAELFATLSAGMEAGAAIALLFDAFATEGFKGLLKCVKAHKALIQKTVPTEDEAAQNLMLDWLTKMGAEKIASGENPKALAKVCVTDKLCCAPSPPPPPLVGDVPRHATCPGLGFHRAAWAPPAT